MLRDPDGCILAIILLFEINQIAARVDDRDAERIPISFCGLGDGGGGHLLGGLEIDWLAIGRWSQCIGDRIVWIVRIRWHRVYSRSSTITGGCPVIDSKSKSFTFPEWLHFQRRVRKKKPRENAGLSLYLEWPDPGPEGASVDPLGEALGPRVFPDGLWVLFGAVTEAPELPVVVPLVVPVVEPLAAEPPAELPLLPAVAPPACASAKVLESANAVANAIVVNFMVVSLVMCRG